MQKKRPKVKINLMKEKKAPEKDEADKKEEKRRENGLLSISVDIRSLTRPFMKGRKKRPYLPELLMYWSEIMPEIKETASPVKLSPKGILSLETVSAAVGLEIAHRAPVLIERINTFFGAPVVTGLSAKPVLSTKKKPAAERKRTVNKAALEKSIPENTPPELQKKLLEILKHL